MRNPRGIPCHQAVPDSQRRVPNMTGCVGIDEAIIQNPNKDMADKVRMQMGCGGQNFPYGPRTAYNGYSGYHRDD